MGREAIAVCRWQGEVAEARLHLDSQALQLRGQIRLDIPRSAIQDVEIVEDGLRVLTHGPVLELEFGAPDALKWQKALLKRPPTLAEKLGISAEAPAFVMGNFNDAELASALMGRTSQSVGDAAVIVAILLQDDALEKASDLARAHPDKHIWMVHQKGKTAVVGDAVIRTHMRGLGFIDSKTSAVSDQLTTTRYRLRSS